MNHQIKTQFPINATKATRRGASTKPRIVLGIDPGSRIVGFGCLRSFGVGKSEIVDAGVIRVDTSLSQADRLGALHEAMYELVERLQPDLCVIERPFFGVNAASALKLGEARGALMSAVNRLGVAIAEITPAEVKRKIAGGGAADKEGVSRAVEMFLGFERGRMPFDVTDALAIALTHIHFDANRWGRVVR